MSRILAYALKIAILVALGYWLVEHQGQINIHWGGYIIETTTAVAALIILAALGLAAGIYNGWYRIVTVPGRWGEKRKAKRKDKGYEALTKGLIAVAAGDATMAGKLAGKARRSLDDAPLTMLLSAQAAQLNGHHEKAREIFRAMLEQPELAFFGVRGLLTHELRQNGRRDASGAVNREALKLAREAFRLEPTSPWVVESLFDLEMLAEEYDRGIGLVDQMQRLDLLTRDEARRRKAAVMTARSMAATADERHTDARNHAERAVRLAPAFPPAVTMLAQFYAADGKLRKARSILDRAWQIEPHPDLAAAWTRLSPYDDAEGRLRWMERLCTGRGIEDYIALAPLLTENGRWDDARKALQKAIEAGAGVRPLRLLAELELKESNDTVAASEWLAKAADAPAAPAWVSTETGNTQRQWTPYANDTGRFDVLVWTVPAPAGSEALILPPASTSAVVRPVLDGEQKPASAKTIDAPYTEVSAAS
jgi:HemY protein